MKEQRGLGLSSTTLRYIAMLFMLLDHLWATVVPGQNWLTYVGRMAMPIFAFLISEGYVHTHDVKQYKKRLLLFGLLAEIPFNLMMIGSAIFPFQNNVMFTLLLGLWAIEVIDRLKQSKEAKPIVKNGLILLLIVVLSKITFVDYNTLGVAMVVLFYVTRGVRLAKLWQLIGMVLLNIVWHKGMMVPVTIGNFSFEFVTQGFAVFALLWIWVYNGKKGSSNKAVQYFAYAFYPVHMLVLYIITCFI